MAFRSVQLISLLVWPFWGTARSLYIDFPCPRPLSQLTLILRAGDLCVLYISGAAAPDISMGGGGGGGLWGIVGGGGGGAGVGGGGGGGGGVLSVIVGGSVVVCYWDLETTFKHICVT